MENKGKILVVDDESGIRQGCRRALEPQGFTVDTAATLREGLGKIKLLNYDVVLLDVMLPDGRGIDLIKELYAKDPESVAIVITGYATVELAVEAIKQGAYDFISKPFTADLLLMTVNQGLERRRLSLETKRLQAIEEQAAQLAREKEEIEQLDQYKTEFTLMVAHELRAPITALQSFLLSILKGYVPAEQQQEILQRAVDRVQELLDLVNDLLSLASARKELAPTERQIVSLEDSLNKVAPLFKNQAEQKGMKLTFNIIQSPKVNADPDQMVQIWTNLISNAIKYTPDGGQATVSLDERNGWAIGSVEDTGIGIAPEDQSKIFEEFYRTTLAKSFSRLGTGLGLTLVKRIVERYGGKIEVESQQGKGSRFIFQIPAASNSVKNPDTGSQPS